MRSFAHIPHGVIGVAGQGYVPGQSNRSTQGTYFDAKGVMRVAPPYALRPNYVYQGGKWVRQGWLKEAQAMNYITGIGGDMGPLGGLPDSHLIHRDAGYQPGVSGVPDPNQINCFSVFIHWEDPRTTASYLDYWWIGGGSDGSTIDVKNKRINNPSSTGWFGHLTDYGSTGRLSFYGGPPHSDGWPGYVVPRGGDCVISCPMLEKMDIGKPATSWVAYQKTRAAD